MIRFVFEQFENGYWPVGTAYSRKARHSDLVSHLARTPIGEILNPVCVDEVEDCNQPLIMPMGLRGPLPGWDLESLLSRTADYLERFPNMTVLLDHSWETGIPTKFEDVERAVARRGLPVHRFVYLVSNPRVKVLLAGRRLMQAEPGRKRMRVEGFFSFLLYSSVQFALRYQRLGGDLLQSSVPLAGVRLQGEQDLGRDNQRVEDECIDAADLADDKRQRPYYFLSMNRRPRPHRVQLGYWIYANGLRDKGIVSMPSRDYTGDFKNFPSARSLRDFFQNGETGTRIDDYLASLPWVIDDNMDESGHTSTWAYRNSPANTYLDSYFSVVSESGMSFESNAMRITEKTFKPLFNGHPFLVLGSPGTLSLLKEYGFETFPDLFDESYDDIREPGRRTRAVFAELKRLCERPVSQVHEDFLACKPALETNRRLLMQHPVQSAARYQSLINTLSDSCDSRS